MGGWLPLGRVQTQAAASCRSCHGAARCSQEAGAHYGDPAQPGPERPAFTSSSTLLRSRWPLDCCMLEHETSQAPGSVLHG